MFEAFKMKEWMARNLPQLRRDASSVPARLEKRDALRLANSLCDAVIVRVELPMISRQSAPWHTYADLAIAHKLPLPFDNVLLELPTDHVWSGIKMPTYSGILVHLQKDFMVESVPDWGKYKDYPDTTNLLHILITPVVRDGHWSMFPYIEGFLLAEDGNVRVDLAEQVDPVTSHVLKSDDRQTMDLVSIIAVALGYLMSCRAEPQAVSSTRRAMMKHHRPRRDEYRIAVIDPDKLRRYEKKEPLGTHASPCPHDRRGHLRKLRSGREIWVKDCKVRGGAVAAEGFLVKDYVVGSTGPATEPTSV